MHLFFHDTNLFFGTVFLHKFDVVYVVFVADDFGITVELFKFNVVAESVADGLDVEAVSGYLTEDYVVVI